VKNNFLSALCASFVYNIIINARRVPHSL